MDCPKLCFMERVITTRGNSLEAQTETMWKMAGQPGKCRDLLPRQTVQFKHLRPVSWGYAEIHTKQPTIQNRPNDQL